jgi:adenylate cyclase
MQRRPTAILAADVVGYSKLMTDDESGTLAALRAHRKELFDPTTAHHGGRIVKLMGDGTLVEFLSVVDAVLCALALQQSLAEQPGPIKPRIGINLGDVIIDGDDIYGNGVNVATRLESQAAAGGICISSAAHDQIRGKVEAEFANVGKRTLKNIAEPMDIWVWPSPGATQATFLSGPLALPDKPSIAVLPFTNMSGDQE